MTGSHGPATEVAARGDAHAGLLRGSDCGEGLLAKCLARALPLSEAPAVGRGEAYEGLEDRERRHESGPTRHRGRGRRIDPEAVLDRVDPGRRGDRGALPLRVRGDLLSALVNDLDRGRELVDRER